MGSWDWFWSGNRLRKSFSAPSPLEKLSLPMGDVIDLESIPEKWPPLINTNWRTARQFVNWCHRIYNSFGGKADCLGLRTLNIIHSERIWGLFQLLEAHRPRLDKGRQIVCDFVEAIGDELCGWGAMHIMPLECALSSELPSAAEVFVLWRWPGMYWWWRGSWCLCAAGTASCRGPTALKLYYSI